MATPAPRLRIARNTLFNLLGQGSPFLAAVIAIPLLVRGLGVDRFGVLTLSWTVIGYFSLFDLGLSRALTQLVAATLGTTGTREAPPVVWTALALSAGLGLIGTLVAAVLSPWLVYSVLKIPSELRAESLHAFYLLAFAIPLVVVTAGLVGILTAFGRFGTLNAIRGPVGVYLLLAPLAVLPFTNSLVAVIGILVVGRLGATLVYLRACRRHLPPLRAARTVERTALRSLFHFGFWMTVTNVVSPILVSLDRLVIGAMVSVTAVAWYATPYEMITKVLIVPSAMLAVLFPAFASTYRDQHEVMVRLCRRGASYIGILLFPVVLVVVAFAHEGLQLWLGPEFARHGAPVLQWLAIGVFVNAIAQVFFTLVQGVGRPDLSARLHLIELPIYVPVLYLATRQFGIVGAAMAWTARIALDCVLLLWMSSRFLGERTRLAGRILAGVAASVAVAALPVIIAPLLARAAFVLVVLALFARLAWSVVLDSDERKSLRRWLARPAVAT